MDYYARSVSYTHLKGMSKVAMYYVSATHVSQLISEAFKYSHIVLASVTYNLCIYPAMHDFLMDMKAPVSYTHLDVYKRQVRISLAATVWTSALMYWPPPSAPV